MGFDRFDRAKLRRILLCILTVYLVKYFYESFRTDQNDGAGSERSHLLPTFCARCFNSIEKEAAQMQKCELLDNSQWLFGKPTARHFDYWLEEPWAKDSLKSNLQLLRISRDASQANFLGSTDVPYETSGYYYFWFLTNKLAQWQGIDEDTHRWRVQSIANTLVETIRMNEKHFPPGSIKDAYLSGEIDRFQKHSSWYKAKENTALVEEYDSASVLEAKPFWIYLLSLIENNVTLGPSTDSKIRNNYETETSVLPFRKFMEKYGKFVKKKRGVVVGSFRPWAEYEALRAGAAHVTTDEYMNLSSVIRPNHPRMGYIHPEELQRQLSEDAFEPFDFAISYSSIEHAGLGRYGDPLNFDADLMELAKLSCIVKPGGLLFLGVPTSDDCVSLNIHRLYGFKRYSLMTECWRLLEYDTKTMPEWDEQYCKNASPQVYGPQPWFVLQNLRGCAAAVH